MILAVGIVGNVENLGLEALGVKVEKTHIVVDGYRQDECAGALCDRRCLRAALAGAQGDA